MIWPLSSTGTEKYGIGDWSSWNIMVRGIKLVPDVIMVSFSLNIFLFAKNNK